MLFGVFVWCNWLVNFFFKRYLDSFVKVVKCVLLVLFGVVIIKNKLVGCLLSVL